MKEAEKATQDGMPGQPFFDYWQSWYEKEWKPFFNMPQFGMTRYYQEHTNQNIDKYYELQAMLTEFSSLLCQPIEKSFQAVGGDVFSAGAQAGEADAGKAYYAKWISTLEKEYMTLFRSTEYVGCLNKAMKSLNDFIISRQTVLEDMLKLLPIPTNSEMDGLYKELYELKKRVRDLEKEQVQH
jgi:class III poly(R)-hydroxyalkanoic acid synthase PhaE subunit